MNGAGILTKVLLIGSLFMLLSGCTPEDVTLYELRQPLSTNGWTGDERHILWLPAVDGTFLVAEAEPVRTNGSPQDMVQDVFALYRSSISDENGTLQLPEQLFLETVTLEEVHTARHYNRTWVLEFNGALLQMPEGERRLFLAGFTKTLIQGNQQVHHQTNFTSTRVFSGGTEVGSFNVFHT